MAALGRLVAGVAHEVNTPLGVGMTAVSFLADQLRGVRSVLGDERADELLAPAEAASAMVQSNLTRAANLVQSFKQVAVDQSTTDIRTVAVREYLEGTLASLHPVLRRTRHRVLVECDPALSMTSRPDALYQIIINLVMNSVRHGYAEGDAGTLRIAATRADGRVTLCYADDGVGMDDAVAAQMYEPFFTTKREQGGTGLGLHIVYNLVSHALGGRIGCSTAPGQGVRFEIVFPAVHPLARAG
jgi:signal transduction histidine kinase